MTPSAPSRPSDDLEQLLQGLQSGVAPGTKAAERVKMRVRDRIAPPHALAETRRLLTPDAPVSARVWRTIAASIAPIGGFSLWQKLRDVFAPATEGHDQVWSRILGRLQPAYARANVYRPLKWAATLVLCLLAVRLSPLLFLAPHTIAEAPSTVSGQFSVLIGGLWQPFQPGRELVLQHPTRIRTDNGEATIVLFDDAVVRLGSGTTVAVNDLSDRPKSSGVQPTVSLQEGELWMLGLVPKYLDGITVGTSKGQVIVHEGSVSIREGKEVTVRVWDRIASVQRRNQQLNAVAGQQVILRKDLAPVLSSLDPAAYENRWVTANLSRDAAHQREIAQMQLERRAASAGYLADSPLYPAKRFAEAVDVLFTLDPDARARKQLTNANTRLNEAAALISRGNESEAAKPLKEYHDAIVALAHGSGSSPAIGSLLQQAVVAQASADTSAALPNDQAYVLKQAVRDTIAALPDTVGKPDTSGDAFLDQLAVVKHQAEAGDIGVAKEKLAELTQSFSAFTSSVGISLEIQQEARATLSTVAAAVEPVQQEASGAEVDQRGLHFTQPIRASEPERPPLNDEQAADRARQIAHRVIETYNTNGGRMRWLQIEFQRLEGNPDRRRILGTIIRLHLLPEGFIKYVNTEMYRVSQEQAAGLPQECTGSGC